MLRIGEFSILSHITINMLRHYDKIGLLQPKHVDHFTGYRYYNENQLPTANESIKFKQVGTFTAATLIFKGHYTKLPEVNESIARWIADNHYKISGPRFNIYHVSPETEGSYDEMVTEVCFPVEAQ